MSIYGTDLMYSGLVIAQVGKYTVKPKFLS